MARRKQRKPKGQQQPYRDRYDKEQRQAIEIKDTAAKMESKDNDVSWWTHYPQLVRDAGSLPMAYALGVEYTLGEGASGTIPGIMALTFIPTYGIAKDATAPINICAKNLYSFVRHANSGSKNYDAPDLMMYLMAMDSAFAFHAFLRRVYGVARQFAPTNRYYSEGLLRAMGFDADDVYQNLAQLRYLVNLMAVKLGSMCVPANMDIFARHSWMSEGLYLDSDTEKAQTYMFVPEGFWKLNNTAESGTQLDYLPLPTDFDLKVEDMYNIFQQLVSPILWDEDMNIMSGDILKAYGDKGVLKLFEIPENYAVYPAYSQEVLSEIENAVCCPFNFVGRATGFEITQNNEINEGYIRFDPEFDYSPVNTTTNALWRNSTYLVHSHLLNFHHDGPTPAEVMIASRMQAYTYISAEDKMKFRTIGTEIIKDMRIYRNYLNQNNGGNTTGAISTSFTNTISAPLSNTGVTEIYEGLAVLAMLEVFDWHPIVILTPITDATHRNDQLAVAGDIDVYTVVSWETCAKQHEVALLSTFDIPQAALIK